MEVRCFCAPGLTEWVCEFENDVIKVLQALQSQGLNYNYENIGQTCETTICIETNDII